MNNLSKRRIWLALTAIYMLAIVIFSLQPGRVFGEPTVQKRFILNFLHIPAYALLMYMLSCCWRELNNKALIISFVFSAAFGALNEWIQSFSPGRYASLSDILLNAAGAGIMLIIIKKYNKNIIETQ